MNNSKLRGSGRGPENRRRVWLRKTLHLSQQEAVASSLMTAIGDNFFNAFAIHLRASAYQMGWLTAFPQLVGAWLQLISVWIGAWCPRRPLVVAASGFQALVVALMAWLAASSGSGAVTLLIVLAMCYHGATNLIQPHWRAWMGSIVPQRRRGAFFASRTRLTMVTSFLVFVGGGALLSLSERQGVVWLGFCLLFSVGFIGRAVSASLMWRMHDPDTAPADAPPPAQPKAFVQTLRLFKHALHDKTFRHFSIFVAGMQGMVAISAPFFAVYQLRDLGFTYFEYSLSSVASIATQFLTLKAWGRFGDRFGNRLMMLITSVFIPLIPILWVVSPNFYSILLVQAFSGLSWSGYTLSTSNYLYDIRPHKTNFATYAAVQSGLGATLVFLGALLGGYLASALPDLLGALAWVPELSSSLLVVFLTSALLRLAVVAWFIPRAGEPTLRRHSQLLEVIYRVARFNAISGVVLDWLTVVNRKKQSKRKKQR